MEQFSDSDKNPAMVASTVFQNILDKIQSSNLNFHLQVSPFSAQISLKKTLVKDQFGNLLLPPAQFSPRISKNETLSAENLKLENDLLNLQNKYEDVVNDCAKAYQMVQTLENQLKQDDVYKDTIAVLETKVSKAEAVY